jgi:BlaI family transcriptional regulator, penicillinase repressor
MPRPPTPHPTDGELEILRVLWSQCASSLSAICEAMRSERDVATTTVATMLRVMHDKGLVKRAGAARGATWSAAVTHKTAAKRMVGKLVDHLFDGAADRLVAHMIEGGQLTTKQLAELRELINQGSHKKTRGNEKAKTIATADKR